MEALSPSILCLSKSLFRVRKYGETVANNSHQRYRRASSTQLRLAGSGRQGEANREQGNHPGHYIC